MGADVVVIDIAARFQDQTEPGISNAKRKTDKYEESVKKTKRELERLSGKKWQATLEAKDKAAAIIQKSLRQLKKFGGKTFTALIKVKDLATAPVRGIFKLFKNPLFSIGAVIGITIGVKDTIETFAGFEKSLSNVRSLVNMTSQNVDADMALIKAKAREMGRTTSKSAKDAADAFGYMALAGWDTQKMLESIKPVLDLSIAGDMELGHTSDLVTDSMSSLGKQAGTLDNYLDTVAKTAGTMNTDIDMLMQAFLECGGTVNQMNIPLAEASTLLGVLANRGLKGSEAGTALTSILVNLTATSGQASDAMAQLGVSAFDGSGKFKGYAAVLEEIYDKTKNLTEEEQNYYMSSIGMKMRKEDLQKLLSGISEEYDKALSAIEDSNGALALMAKTKNDNLIGDFKALTSALDEVKIALMDKLAPHFRSFIQWSTSKVPLLQQNVEKMADAIGQKITELKENMDSFMGSQEWQDADFFGKIHIAWDKIIAEPFDEWWGSTGKAWMAEKAESIGSGLGAGLKFGVMGLLGIDVSAVVTDGASIGKSFAEGFVSGFDPSAVGKALFDGLKNMVKDAATILPGGDEASSTGWLSAGLLGAGFAKMGGFKLLGGLAKGAGGLFGKPLPGQSGMGPFSNSYATMSINAGVVYLNSASSGPPINQSMLPGGRSLPAGAGAAATAGPLGLFAKLGTKLGSGAASTGGTAAVGAASAVGGMLGAAGIFSGLKDIFKSFRVQDKQEKSDLRWGGGTKIGMVGAGAAAGAAVGSVVPVVGTAAGALVGAGVGGLGALFAGNELGEKIRDTLSETVFDGGWWSEKWTFVTETAPQAVFSAIGTAVGFIESTLFSGEWWAAKWNGAVEWGKETGAKISAWWSENISGKLFNGEWWAEKWNGAVTWGKETGGKIADWWKDNIGEKLFSKDWWSEKWNNVKEWGKGILSEISSWWGDMTSAYSEGKEKGASAAQPHANGGIMTNRHYGMVAEDGPEAIIPLSPSRRSRGLDLWQRSGEILGVRPYADGGVLDAPSAGHQGVSYRKFSDDHAPQSSGGVIVTSSGIGQPIKIDLGGIHFEVKVENASDPSAVVRIIRENLGNIADDLCQNIMRALAPVFGNMPQNAEGL